MARYHSEEENSFLALEDVSTGSMMNPSIIFNSGLGSFEVNKFGNSKTVGWYYVPLVYNFLAANNQERETYWEGYVRLTIGNF